MGTAPNIADIGNVLSEDPVGIILSYLRVEEGETENESFVAEAKFASAM